MAKRPMPTGLQWLYIVGGALVGAGISVATGLGGAIGGAIIGVGAAVGALPYHRAVQERQNRQGGNDGSG